MRPLFLLPGASRRDTAVQAWMDGRPRELGVIAKHWFDAMRACGDDVREIVHDGHPTACVDDAAFAYVNAFTSHVNVGFYHGAELPDPAALLQGTGKYMRHVKVEPQSELDADALRALITTAHRDVRRRLAVERKVTTHERKARG